MCFYYDDVYTVCGKATLPRARKEHSCDDCHVKIKKGENYYCYSGIHSEGASFTTKICARCRYDRMRVAIWEFKEGCAWSESFPYIGELNEALQERDMAPTPPEEVPGDFDPLHLDDLSTRYDAGEFKQKEVAK